MSRRKTTPYIIKTMSSEANRLPLLVCFSLSVPFVLFRPFPCRGGGGCASGRLKVRCCWKGSEVKLLLDRPPLVATAPPICNPRKGVVCIRLFKVVPTASASPRPKVRRHIWTEDRGITLLSYTSQIVVGSHPRNDCTAWKAIWNHLGKRDYWLRDD